MKKQYATKLVLALAALVFCLPMATTVFSQVEMRYVPAEAYEKLTRPQVTFVHDAHNLEAGIDDCATCHHVYDDGQLVPDDNSAGVPCSDCHALEGEGITPEAPGLTEAYHGQCMGCHDTMNRGPITCGSCHNK